jgi:DNA polymerase-3 subunit chi
MRIDFYRLSFLPLEKALPRLLEKAYEKRMNALVVTKDAEETEFLDRELWTYTTKFFLPHGTIRDNRPERQPVLIAEETVDTNRPAVVASTGKPLAVLPPSCERLLYVFDGNDPNALQQAREYWKQAGGEEAERHYWQQDKAGKWAEGNK